MIQSDSTSAFNPDCIECPRLVTHRNKDHHDYPEYHANPVAPFGAEKPQLLIVGLAPGMHGANATGRPFTGDYAGILLYKTLYNYGFTNKPESIALNDGLKLTNCRITNAVKCLPPENKPSGQEISQCNRYLQAELEFLDPGTVILALGRIAHLAVIKAIKLKQKDYPFGHGALFPVMGNRWLLDSYHCSRYNTQTGRLTEEMFNDIFHAINKLLNK